MSNLKQIGLGLAQYSSDYDEKLPSTFFGPWPGYYSWHDATMPYVKSNQIFDCPSDSVAGHKFTPRSTGSNTVVANGVSGFGSYAGSNAYWWNAEQWGDSMYWPGAMAKPGGWPGSLSQITATATTVFVTDGNGAFQTAWAGDWEDPESIDMAGGTPSIHAAPVAYNTDQGAVMARHLETTNVLFCDGHVKAMKLNALLEKASTGQLRYWTRMED
jgi:prepilin-type processing-associated H-X9-DG protein